MRKQSLKRIQNIIELSGAKQNLLRLAEARAAEVETELDENPSPKSLLMKDNPTATDLGRALVIDHLNYYTKSPQSQRLTDEDNILISRHFANMSVSMQLTYQGYAYYCKTSMYNTSVEYSYCMRTIQYSVSKICHDIDMMRSAEELLQRGLSKNDPFYAQHNIRAILTDRGRALCLLSGKIRLNLKIMRATDIYLNLIGERLDVRHMDRLGAHYWNIVGATLKNYEAHRHALKNLRTDPQTLALASTFADDISLLQSAAWSPDESRMSQARKFFEQSDINLRETRTTTVSLLISDEDENTACCCDCDEDD